MPDSPAALLTAAAKLLRDAAKEASPSPWLTNTSAPHLADRVVFGQSMHWGGYIAQVCNTDYGQNREADTIYIALMHPSVGVDLADWLDDAAEGDEHGEHNPYALAVARQILGQVTE